MSPGFGAKHREAWDKLGIGKKAKKGELYPRFTRKEFDDLKTDYNNQYGYTIRIPQWDDVIHWQPNSMKSPEQLKLEKKMGLIRLLESPAPDWARSYASAMTWIDNIQDTASIAIPLSHYLWKAAPKAFGKILGIVGWLFTGYDLLNMANALGRLPYSGFGAKREVCKVFSTNPFSKKAQFSRLDRIKNWKPNLADFIQAAQVTDQLFGVGTCLGGIMGAINDSIYGAYRYLTGQPVRFTFDPPDLTPLDLLGSRGMTAAANISTQGQVFSEMDHFWTYATSALSSIAYAGTHHDNYLSDIVHDPMGILMPAPEPTDPITRAVIEEEGLNIKEGVRWPYNGQTHMALGDWIDATVEPARANTVQYLNRHCRDSYGYVAATSLDWVIPHNIIGIDPDGELEEDDTDEMKVFWQMVKVPILPEKPVTQEQSDAFWSWVLNFPMFEKGAPGALQIKGKFSDLGINFKTAYPTERTQDADEFWPPGFQAV